MKKTLKLLTILFAFTVFISCDSSDDTTTCEEKTWYEDKDGDGKGNPDVYISACEQPDGYVLDNTDTDDNTIYSKVYEGNVELNTIEKYNIFINNNYTEITGDLHIHDIKLLTSLAGLEKLTTIGALEINSNNSLTSLNGLDNLISIGDYLRINDNNSLTSLKGLDNLNSIGYYLYIGYNDSLTSLNGLDNLISIGDYLRINDNNSLTSLKGLDNLTSIGYYLFIEDNDSLTSLNGLDNLISINGGLTMWLNKSLVNFCSITNLINSDGLVGEYKVYDNAYNPTIKDIKAGRCSQ